MAPKRAHGEIDSGFHDGPDLDASDDEFGFDQEVFDAVAKDPAGTRIVTTNLRKRGRDDDDLGRDSADAKRGGANVRSPLLIKDQVTATVERAEYLTTRQFAERYKRGPTEEERNHPENLLQTDRGGLVTKSQYAWTARNTGTKQLTANELAGELRNLGLNKELAPKPKLADNRVVMVPIDGVPTAIDPQSRIREFTLAELENDFGKGNVKVRTDGGAYQLPQTINERAGYLIRQGGKADTASEIVEKANARPVATKNVPEVTPSPDRPALLDRPRGRAAEGAGL